MDLKSEIKKLGTTHVEILRIGQVLSNQQFFESIYSSSREWTPARRGNLYQGENGERVILVKDKEQFENN